MSTARFGVYINIPVVLSDTDKIEQRLILPD